MSIPVIYLLLGLLFLFVGFVCLEVISITEKRIEKIKDMVFPLSESDETLTLEDLVSDFLHGELPLDEAVVEFSKIKTTDTHSPYIRARENLGLFLHNLPVIKKLLLNCNDYKSQRMALISGNIQSFHVAHNQYCFLNKIKPLPRDTLVVRSVDDEEVKTA